MGKQAKIKKLKKQGNFDKLETEQPELNTNEFVKQIEAKGYTFKNIRRSPDVPNHKIEPQI
jgi:hypothetical protein